MSVVVAAYQAAASLPACLTAILGQVPAPEEVIVVDDGSTDQTPSVLSAYGDAVRVVRQPNRGEAAAKNAGLRAARFDVVAFVDADDVLLPGWLNAVRTVMRGRPDLALVATDAHLVVDGERRGRAYGPGMAFEVSAQRAEILRRNYVIGFVAVRRSVLLRAGGFDERVRVISDWTAWARLVLSGGRVGLIDEPLAEYHVRSGSLSDNPLEVLRGRIDVLERLAEDPRATESDRRVLASSLDTQRSSLQLHEARRALGAGRVQEARRLCLAVAMNPRHSIRTRAKSLVSALMPSLARARLRSSVGGGFRRR